MQAEPFEIPRDQYDQLTATAFEQSKAEGCICEPHPRVDGVTILPEQQVVAVHLVHWRRCPLFSDPTNN